MCILLLLNLSHGTHVRRLRGRNNSICSNIFQLLKRYTEQNSIRHSPPPFGHYTICLPGSHRWAVSIVSSNPHFQESSGTTLMDLITSDCSSSKPPSASSTTEPPPFEYPNSGVFYSKIRNIMFVTDQSIGFEQPRLVVKKFLAKPQSKGEGVVERSSIGRPELKSVDPFLMLDEFSVSPHAGFPDHPHRDKKKIF